MGPTDVWCMPAMLMPNEANQFLPCRLAPTLSTTNRGRLQTVFLRRTVTLANINTLGVSPDQVQRWTSSLYRAGGYFVYVTRKLFSSRRAHAAPESTSKLTGCPCTWR